MLHYYGDKLAMSLGNEARFYINLYATEGAQYAFVPFMDLAENKKRFVKFQWLAATGWVYVDLVDAL